MLDLDFRQIIIQMIAFIVMFWIMKKYGWRPLLHTLKKRQENIQAQFDSIALQKEETKKMAEDYEKKLQDINLEARKKMQEVLAESQSISIEMQKNAQNQAKEILQKAKHEINNEFAKAKIQLKNDIVALALSMTEKILRKTLDEPCQKKLVSDFVDEVELK